MKFSINFLKPTILLAIASILSSCASIKQKQFDHLLANNSCDEAIQNMPNTRETSFDQGQIAGTMASYTLTGIGYGVDVTVFFGGSAVVSLVVCSPLMMLEASRSIHSLEYTSKCVASVFNKVDKAISPNERLGKQAYDKTEKWRCPDVSDFSKNLRGAASCFESKNDQEGLERALVYLNLLKDKDFQNNCIAEDEKVIILSQHEGIHKKLENLKRNNAK